MAYPAVRLRLPDGAIVEVPSGGLVGRLRSASARIDDARISEVQALVSLRGRQLKLLALRGMLRTRGGPTAEITLRVGQRIELARDVWIEVVEVRLPERILALRGLGAVPLELYESVHSIVLTPEPALRYHYEPEAAAHIWHDGEGWRLQRAGAAPTALEEGSTFSIAGQRVEVIGVSLSRIATPPTRQPQADRVPMRLVARQETVHVHREGVPIVTFEGNAARILSELIRFDAPTPWEWIAAEIWGELDRSTLRIRWDRNLKTLRARIRERGLPRDLVRSDGHGNIELVLKEGDRTVDEG